MPGMPPPSVIETAHLRVSALDATARSWSAQLRHSGEPAGECSWISAPEAGGGLELSCQIPPGPHRVEHAEELLRALVAWAVEWQAHGPVRVRLAAEDEGAQGVARASGLESLSASAGVSTEIWQAPRVEVRRSFDGDTREAVLNLWVATTRAGGAVGFVAADSREAHAAALAAHEEQLRDGQAVAVLLRAGDGRVVGLGFWVKNANPLLAHTRWAYRVMTDPAERGRNLGRLLMAAMHCAARAEGVELVILGVRGGMGTEGFYATCGYREAGRIPGAIRVAPGDDRDDITMYRPL